MLRTSVSEERAPVCWDFIFMLTRCTLDWRGVELNKEEQEIETLNSEVATVHTEQEMPSILEDNKFQDQVAMYNQDATETNARVQLTFTEYDLLLSF